MTTSAQRFDIRSPAGRMIVGFDDLNAAGAVALDYGEGAHLVDTNAQAYHPIAQEASDGELVYVQICGRGAGKFSVERNLNESIKKGHAAIVHAFLAVAPAVRLAHEVGRARLGEGAGLAVVIATARLVLMAAGSGEGGLA